MYSEIEEMMKKDGVGNNPLERLKWLEEKKKEAKIKEKKALRELNEFEKKIGTSESGLKEAAQKNIEKWKKDGENIEAKLLHFILELRLYLDLTRLRVAVLEDNPEHANQIAKELKESFGIDLE